MARRAYRTCEVGWRVRTENFPVRTENFFRCVRKIFLARTIKVLKLFLGVRKTGFLLNPYGKYGKRAYGKVSWNRSGRTYHARMIFLTLGREDNVWSSTGSASSSPASPASRSLSAIWFTLNATDGRRCQKNLTEFRTWWAAAARNRCCCFHASFETGKLCVAKFRAAWP